MQPKEFIKNIASPFRQFIRNESASGIFLIISTLMALIWANSAYSDSYFDFWETPITIAVGDNTFKKSILLLVNDGLMAIFFFVIGLEIKREILEGELSNIRKASLPIFAALGGMIVPVSLFFLLNNSGQGQEGWGIPMATDIAFSLGILSLLGKRVPLSLKVFLTAFAIIDDIGAILVIAIFYSHGIHWNALLFAGFFLLILIILNLVFSIKRNWTYLTIGGFLWYYLLVGGIHPTIAGVLLALTIPANNKIRLNTFKENLRKYTNKIFDPEGRKEANSGMLLKHEQINTLEALRTDVKQVEPPLQRLEFQLNEFVAFVVMPLFALANAGIALHGGFEQIFSRYAIIIASSLVLGKMAGIFVFSWLSIRLGLARLPANTSWLNILGLSLLGGVGFTMALFISNLAIEDPDTLSSAKLGILVGSLIAGLAGYLLLRITLKKKE